MAIFINLDPSINRSCVIGEADPFLARLLERFVKKSGLRTKRAQTGEALLDLVEREKPALIILEPQLPGKVKGWEAYQQLKVEPETCHIPMIICSWLNEDEVICPDWFCTFSFAEAGTALPRLCRRFGSSGSRAR